MRQHFCLSGINQFNRDERDKDLSEQRLQPANFFFPGRQKVKTHRLKPVLPKAFESSSN
jgi:hypothetical protein